MPLAEFLNDLQQLERAASGAQGPLILEAFTRHTPFDAGAVWLREPRGAAMKLAAKCGDVNVDEVLDRELPGMVVVPIRTSKEHLGVIALSGDAASEEELRSLHLAGTFLGTLINNQRLSQEAREDDFQLKYRLWELESLYDIGLSIAGTLNIEELADEVLFRMISLINARRAALFLRVDGVFKAYRSFGDVPVTEEHLQRMLDTANGISLEGGTVVAVPINGNNQIIGVLAAADRETREGGVSAFEASELRLLSLFANQVGIALENARLH